MTTAILPYVATMLLKGIDSSGRIQSIRRDIGELRMQLFQPDEKPAFFIRVEQKMQKLKKREALLVQRNTRLQAYIHRVCTIEGIRRRRVFAEEEDARAAAKCISIAELDLLTITVTPKNDDTCSICMDQGSDISTPVQIGCGHVFCMSCIRTWTRRANTCPMCRTPLLDL